MFGRQSRLWQYKDYVNICGSSLEEASNNSGCLKFLMEVFVGGTESVQDMTDLSGDRLGQEMTSDCSND